MPAVPAIALAEYSSARKTFSMSRWAMTLPAVARRSPPITTPPGNVTATIVEPRGKCSLAGTAHVGSTRLPGSMFGECTDRNSVNDEGLWLANAPGRRPGAEPCDVTRLLPLTADAIAPATETLLSGRHRVHRHDPSPRPLTATPAYP